MKFLVDESLPRAVTRALLAAGHDAADVRDVGLRGAPDGAIAVRAKGEERVVVAGDTDFANALRFPPARTRESSCCGCPTRGNPRTAQRD